VLPPGQVRDCRIENGRQAEEREDAHIDLAGLDALVVAVSDPTTERCN